MNWKVLRKSLNVNKLHMGDESDMLSLLGVGRGNLTPFSAMNDTEYCVTELPTTGFSYVLPGTYIYIVLHIFVLLTTLLHSNNKCLGIKCMCYLI